MKKSKLKFLSALLCLLASVTTAQTAEVYVHCKAVYVTEFYLLYMDPSKPKITTVYGKTYDFNTSVIKRLPVGFSHSFTIPDNATEITVGARTVNLVGETDTITYYKYLTTDGIGDNWHYTYGTLFDPQLSKKKKTATRPLKRPTIIP